MTKTDQIKRRAERTRKATNTGKFKNSGKKRLQKSQKPV